MTPKEKARKYRIWAKSHTSEQLYRRYKKRAKKGTEENKDALREVTEVLKAVRVYEHYVKDLERMYKKELLKTKRELFTALKKVRELQRLARKNAIEIKELREKCEAKEGRAAKAPKPAKAVKRPSDTVERTKTPAERKKERELRIVQRKKAALQKAEQKFARMDAERRAAARGDHPAEAIGRRSHESKDVYADILDRLEAEKQLYFTQSQKEALARSATFRQHLHDRFRDKLTDEQMEEIWDKNFGKGSGGFTVNKIKDDEEKVNWTYTPRNKRK